MDKNMQKCRYKLGLSVFFCLNGVKFLELVKYTLPKDVEQGIRFFLKTGSIHVGLKVICSNFVSASKYCV